MTTALSQKSVSPDDFLLHCIRLGISDQEHDDSAEGFFDGGHWEAFIHKAEKEGCTGVIYHNISRHQSRHNIPSAVLHQLEQEYLTNTGRNLLMDSELSMICQQFDAQELPALTVRGVVFFDRIYPEIGMRPLIDMDFVVHRNDFDRARRILNDLGFQCHDCYPFFFFKDDIYVDLHLDSINFWRIKGWPSSIDITHKELWKKTLPFCGYTYVRTLDVYDSIIHCCEHLMRHSFGRLIWFLDIVYLIQGKAGVFQWDRLIGRTADARALKAVHYVMAYLSQRDLCSVPSQSMAALESGSMNGIERWYYRLLLADRRDRISGDVLSLLAVPGFWRKVGLLWNGIFIEKEKFPLVRTRLTVWTYVQRIFRLMGHVLKKIYCMVSFQKFG